MKVRRGNFKGDPELSKRCARHAVETVREFGGVLEQPESSGKAVVGELRGDRHERR